MYEFPQDETLVPFDGSFDLHQRPTGPGDSAGGKKALAKALKHQVKKISELQRILYAQDRFSVLLVFQAMDAAGKDGTIRAVMSGVNPAGCQVFSFKSPTARELDHDYLWRTTSRMPERGRIGVFNRSYYEEVLAVRVRPEYLVNQRIPRTIGAGAVGQPLTEDEFWAERYQSIRDHELHLARNGTVVIKFWLNVSLDEQKRRFLPRLDNADKYWKFSKSDLSERERWPDYMDAYQVALNETSRAYAPWYAVPADNKPWMRLRVATIVANTLESLPLAFPEKSAEELSLFDAHRTRLLAEE